MAIETAWPMPRHEEAPEPHFLFLLTLPYSGSTVISGLINTSHRTMILQEHAEGQWLVPGLCGEDRWNKSKHVNYESVRAVWLSRFQLVRQLGGNIDVVIEKSPPNVVRIDGLRLAFKNHSLLANNRDPVAYCASALYRLHAADAIGPDARMNALQGLAKGWVKRSSQLRDVVIRLQVPLLSYEAFCAAPADLLGKLRLPPGVADTIRVNATVKVKDYAIQAISNQNPRQVALLSESEIEEIERIVAEHPDLLCFFGYQDRIQRSEVSCTTAQRRLPAAPTGGRGAAAKA